MGKFSTYFLTENGRKLVFAGATTLGLSLFAGNFIPQTILLNQYRGIITSYRSGIEEPVSEKVKDVIEIACEKLDLHPYYRRIIKPFTVYGFDLYEGGSTKYRFGCALGIPTNFNYDSPKDINKQQVRFRNELIPWSSENGKLLEESLVLTENEKLFAICKSILQLDTHRVLMNSIFPSLTFIFVYSVGIRLNQKLNLYARPLQVRMVMYSILGLFGLGNWAFLKDYNQVSYDTNIDKKLAEMGSEFVSAGATYYEKMLKRNIALRNLIGNDAYTAKGNENFFIRQKRLPITYRKAFFDSKLEELKQKLNESNKVVA